jgi:protein arginine N-methyltransferase 1
LIPRRDTLWVALISGPRIYHKIVGPYRDNPYQLNMEAPVRFVTNEWRRGSQLSKEDLFLEPQHWATLDYHSWDHPDVSGELVWDVDRTDTVNGFCVWFDASLTDNVTFSNAPGNPLLIYSRAYFPWSEPVDVGPGDRVRLSLLAKLVGSEYVWTWNTLIGRGGSASARKVFRQSTLHRAPYSRSDLRKRTSDYVPKLGTDGELHRVILEAMDGRTTLQQIASRVADLFPGRFASWHEAFHEVCELSQQYSC